MKGGQSETGLWLHEQPQEHLVLCSWDGRADASASIPALVRSQEQVEQVPTQNNAQNMVNNAKSTAVS